MLQISLDISASAQIQFLCGWFISNLPEQYQLKPQQSNVSWAQSKDQSHLKLFLSLSFNSWSEKIMFWRDFNYKEKPYWILSGWQLLSAQSRDSKGISKLPQILLILPYKISCSKGSSEIPLISLRKCKVYAWMRFVPVHFCWNIFEAWSVVRKSPGMDHIIVRDIHGISKLSQILLNLNL